MTLERFDDELSAVDRLWIAMGWLGDAIFQRHMELYRAERDGKALA